MGRSSRILHHHDRLVWSFDLRCSGKTLRRLERARSEPGRIIPQRGGSGKPDRASRAEKGPSGAAARGLYRGRRRGRDSPYRPLLTVTPSPCRPRPIHRRPAYRILRARPTRSARRGNRRSRTIPARPRRQTVPELESPAGVGRGTAWVAKAEAKPDRGASGCRPGRYGTT